MRMSIRIAFALFAWTTCLLALPHLETSVTKTTLQSPFYVAGFLVRTNNADEAGGKGKIGDLWQRFFKENLGAQIPNRADSALTVVYSEYASDEKGDYNY